MATGQNVDAQKRRFGRLYVTPDFRVGFLLVGFFLDERKRRMCSLL